MGLLVRSDIAFEAATSRRIIRSSFGEYFDCRPRFAIAASVSDAAVMGGGIEEGIVTASGGDAAGGFSVLKMLAMTMCKGMRTGHPIFLARCKGSRQTEQ